MAKKTSIRDLGSMMDQPATPVEEGASPRRRVGAPLNSPINTASGVDPFRKEAMMLPLPLSGGEIEMSLRKLDPASCFASPLNPREQTLLSLDDPEVARLKLAIETEGQRDPVLARPVTGEGGVLRYEVVCGTTRLFVCQALSAERGEPFELRAWVGRIPDADVRRLAKAENQDRRNLSAWEIAQALRADLASLYKGRSQEFIAEQEGISQALVSQLLRLAELDLDIVRRVSSPGAISRKAGLQILSLLESVDAARRERLLAAVGSEPYAAAADLLGALKSARAAQEEKKPSLGRRDAIVVKGKDGAPVAKLTPHRTAAGRFKIELFGFSEADATALANYIRKLRQAE